VVFGGEEFMRSAIPVTVCPITCFCIAPVVAQPSGPFVSLTLDPASQTVNPGETA